MIAPTRPQHGTLSTESSLYHAAHAGNARLTEAHQGPASCIGSYLGKRSYTEFKNTERSIPSLHANWPFDRNTSIRGSNDERLRQRVSDRGRDTLSHTKSGGEKRPTALQNDGQTMFSGTEHQKSQAGIVKKSSVNAKRMHAKASDGSTSSVAQIEQPAKWIEGKTYAWSDAHNAPPTKSLAYQVGKLYNNGQSPHNHPVASHNDRNARASEGDARGLMSGKSRPKQVADNDDPPVTVEANVSHLASSTEQPPNVELSHLPDASVCIDDAVVEDDTKSAEENGQDTIRRVGGMFVTVLSSVYTIASEFVNLLKPSPSQHELVAVGVDHTNKKRRAVSAEPSTELPGSFPTPPLDTSEATPNEDDHALEKSPSEHPERLHAGKKESKWHLSQTFPLSIFWARSDNGDQSPTVDTSLSTNQENMLPRFDGKVINSDRALKSATETVNLLEIPQPTDAVQGDLHDDKMDEMPTIDSRPLRSTSDGALMDTHAGPSSVGFHRKSQVQEAGNVPFLKTLDAYPDTNPNSTQREFVLKMNRPMKPLPPPIPLDKRHPATLSRTICKPRQNTWSSRSRFALPTGVRIQQQQKKDSHERDSLIASLVDRVAQVKQDSPIQRELRRSQRKMQRRLEEDNRYRQSQRQYDSWIEAEALRQSQQQYADRIAAENEAAELIRVYEDERRRAVAEQKYLTRIAAQEADLIRIQEQEIQRKALEAERQRQAQPLLRTLTKAEDTKLQTALAGNSLDKVVCTTREGVPLRRHDFVKLIPDDGYGYGSSTWLNDEVVNAFFNDIITRKLAQMKWTKTLTIGAPYAFYPSMWTTSIKGAAGVSAIKNWSRRKGIQGKKLLDTEMVFFPVNTGSHWTLLIISPKARRLEYLDSLSDRGAATYFFKIAREWLAMELGATYVPEEWTESTGQSARQQNSNDCGVFCCINGLAAAKGRPFSDVAPVDDGMMTARKMLGWILIRGGFGDEWDL